MRVLFDHNMPKPFRRHLHGHDVVLTKEIGMEEVSNGALFQAAADSGFDVFLSVDKNIPREHNLAKLPIAVLIIDAPNNRSETLAKFADALLDALTQIEPCVLHWLARDGRLTRYQVD